MSGHSKWSQIKNKKASTDAKRGQLFAKLSKSITLAAKEHGADPKNNPRLSSAIDEAKSMNMPNDNIERAINKAMDKDSANLKDVLYEAYGPGGTALIVTAVTDNSNRTTNEIKHILSEHDGKLGEQGSAMWAFDKDEKGYTPKFPLSIAENDLNKFEKLLIALDDHNDTLEIYSNVGNS
jgi:YebC/PmpR family DNA-binding regulatory protein